MLRILSILTFAAITQLPCAAQLTYEREPIRYSHTQPTDRVAQLIDKLEDGEVTLQWEPGYGYLKSVLRELNIPVSSQVLVFSKTSLQVGKISRHTPRAVYFTDDVYVGWVQHGGEIEISAVDPVLGGTFYSIRQQPDSAPVLRRETSRCLQCHGSTHTRRVPGHIVRSVYPDANGQPVFRMGTYLTLTTSPYEERFGGWYVTGKHGRMRHMGNSWLANPESDEEPDREQGANITDLSKFFDPSPYLSPHSDIAAQLVLHHQVHMHNVLTAAGQSGRLTERDALMMNKALERPEDFESESTSRRYATAAEKVVKALLFCGEPRLPDAVSGTTSFVKDFEQRKGGQWPDLGLRKLDLHHRLSASPCSFLIDSDSFRRLPEGVLSRVRQRLFEIADGQNSSAEFQHISENDRQRLLTICKTVWPSAQPVQ